MLGGVSRAADPGLVRASAGVFALLDADLCLTLEHVLALLASFQRAPEYMVPIGRFRVPINVLQLRRSYCCPRCKKREQLSFSSRPSGVHSQLARR